MYLDLMHTIVTCILLVGVMLCDQEHHRGYVRLLRLMQVVTPYTMQRSHHSGNLHGYVLYNHDDHNGHFRGQDLYGYYI